MDPNTPLQPYIPPAVPMPPVGPAPLPTAPTPVSAPPQPAPPARPADPVKAEVIENLRKSNNVLVTVSNNPTVDQLAAAIGLTLLLNKLNKHATAVFSGKVPSTIEFLQPDKTIEKNTDSLRDFIIALDKSKADKLRYKVEDKYVKIFITPYHTSLHEGDLEFSQGDFNVDTVIAIGVQQRQELDQTIIEHGRILHDAVVASVNNKKKSEIGSLNWFEPTASSLCEILVGTIGPLQGDKILLDAQIATAFLTGIVAETERFSNDKTTPHTMNVSATLMKAGANQQLVATKLQEPEPIPQVPEFDVKKMDALAAEKPAAMSPLPPPVPKPAPAPKPVPMPLPAPTPAAPTTPSVTAVSTADKKGSLEIEHKDTTKTLEEMEASVAGEQTGEETGDDDLDKIHIDEKGQLHRLSSEEAAPEQKTETPAAPAAAEPNPIVLTAPAAEPTEAPVLATPPGVTAPPAAMPPTGGDSLSLPSAAPTLAEIESSLKGNPADPATDEKPQTLADLEKSVNSNHVQSQTSVVNDAQQAVQAAVAADTNQPQEPIVALNAQPLVDNLNQTPPASAAPAFPAQLVSPDTGLPPDPTAGPSATLAPPPVPPPLMPPVQPPSE